jgi:RNA polymerase sigma-70 factor (ECF subfamily)
MHEADIEALYKSHGHYLFLRCRAMLGSEDEAYDALQEVFVRLLKTRPRVSDDRPLLPWLNRVTTNHCLNRLRARRVRRHQPFDELNHPSVDSPAELLAILAERRDLVRWLLARADKRTQHVVVGYFFDEHPVERIARDNDISVPTVRRVLKRFLEGARKRLALAEPRGLGRSEV